MKEDEFIVHRSVMVEQVLEFLRPKPGGIYVDCTVGGGGHSLEILRRTGGKCRIIGIDRDPEIIEKARARLREFEGSVILVNERFSNLDRVLDDTKIHRVDGFVFDLGISSFQIDVAERGFSFLKDGPLDMRMDRSGELTAYEIVNEYDEEELARILKDYGEEPLARKIAREIVKFRPVKTTVELAQIVSRVYRSVYGNRSRKHPATKTFQALRIAVNDETEELKKALKKTLDYLRLGGRIVVISFHSIEDRIVKNFFRDNTGVLKILTKKPLYPTGEEIKSNPRARSARMRVAEKC